MSRTLRLRSEDERDMDMIVVGGSKRRSVRGSIYTDGEEERKLMSGGSGGGPEGKRRTGVWGVGGWV